MDIYCAQLIRGNGSFALSVGNVISLIYYEQRNQSYVQDLMIYVVVFQGMAAGNNGLCCGEDLLMEAKFTCYLEGSTIMKMGRYLFMDNEGR